MSYKKLKKAYPKGIKKTGNYRKGPYWSPSYKSKGGYKKMSYGKSKWSRRSYVHQKTGISLTHVALAGLVYLYLTKKSGSVGGLVPGLVPGVGTGPSAGTGGAPSISEIVSDTREFFTDVRTDLGAASDVVTQSASDVVQGGKLGYEIGKTPWTFWNKLNEPFQKVDDFILDKVGPAVKHVYDTPRIAITTFPNSLWDWGKRNITIGSAVRQVAPKQVEDVKAVSSRVGRSRSRSIHTKSGYELIRRETGTPGKFLIK